jgi:hypothetical protein
MDPLSLATLTTALSVLGQEVAKGTASEAGKKIWARVEKAFGWAGAQKDADLPTKAAAAIQEQPKLAQEVTELLQSLKPNESRAAAIVETINAKNVVVVGGDATGPMTFRDS